MSRRQVVELESRSKKQKSSQCAQHVPHVVCKLILLWNIQAQLHVVHWPCVAHYASKEMADWVDEQVRSREARSQGAGGEKLLAVQRKQVVQVRGSSPRVSLTSEGE